MKMGNSALLTGPYDWDPALLPLAEFEARLANVRRAFAANRATALLVHGNSIEQGALAYLTGFVPKLGPAFALVPRNGPLRILASGGPGMISSAKRLTWVEDVRPLGDLQSSIREWLCEAIREERFSIGLWGAEKMAHRPYRAVVEAIRPAGALIDLENELDSLRRAKSPRELTLIRESCLILSAARDAFEQDALDGAGARSAALTAERAAYARGAQDFRILVSARDGGPPLPLDHSTDLRVSPVLAHLAVRRAGYWADGLVTALALPSGALARAEAVLPDILREARAGATSRQLSRAAVRQLPPYKIHPLFASTIGNGLGVSLEEEPYLRHDLDSRLEAGGVYTIRCGAAGNGRDNAIASAMIAITPAGADILWPPAEPSGK